MFDKAKQKQAEKHPDKWAREDSAIEQALQRTLADDSQARQEVLLTAIHTRMGEMCRHLAQIEGNSYRR